MDTDTLIKQKKKEIGGLFDNISSTYDFLNHFLSLGIDRNWRKKAIVGMPPQREVLDVAIGEKKLQRYGYSATFLTADAQAMPFADNRFDGVTCAYGCRNFSNLHDGLSEMHRVLRNGGSLVILEFSYPTSPLIRWLYDLYFSRILPLVGKCISRDKDAYT